MWAKVGLRRVGAIHIGTGEGVVGVNISTNSSKTPDAFLALDISAINFQYIRASAKKIGSTLGDAKLF